MEIKYSEDKTTRENEEHTEEHPCRESEEGLEEHSCREGEEQLEEYPSRESEDRPEEHFCREGEDRSEEHPSRDSEEYPESGACPVGLTIQEVNERIEQGQVNRVHITTDKSVWKIIQSNALTYFNLIFLIIAILLCLVGSYRNLTFLPVVIINTVVGIVQELRAKRTLDKMNMLNAPHSIVVRDGTQSQILSEDLVRDDCVLLRAGNQICADAVVAQGSIYVNEALLTGEAEEIKKEVGDKLLSGSFVVSGQCYAKMECVGKDSYISRLTAEAKAMGEGEQSGMLRSLNQLVKWVGIIIIPDGTILFAQAYYVNEETFKTSIVSMIAAIIGMIPEGLYLLTTVSLALGTIRLGQEQVLLHGMKSIETLARVDVLCVDKTGTITEPGMCVEQIVTSGENPEGQMKLPELEHLLAEYSSAIQDDNMTIKAIREYVAALPLVAEKRKDIKSVPFSSTRKYSMVSFKDESYILGAPESVMGAQYYKVESEIAPFLEKGYRILMLGKIQGNKSLDNGTKEDALYIEELSERDALPEGEELSQREALPEGEELSKRDALPEGEELSQREALSEGEELSKREALSEGEELSKREALPEGEELSERDALSKVDVPFKEAFPKGVVVPLGYVILANPIRQNAKETFDYFRSQGVAIKVISGDHPASVSEIAKMAGIENADAYIDASDLLTEEEIEKAAGNYTVFGRVTPKQKQMLVKAMQKAGHTVAMTGDGVNDILAMKDADCSVAMASGSEAAAQAAQVVLMDSDFAHMPEVVLEGRRVVNNIQRSASLFLVKNIFSLLLAVFSAVFAITYPLEPSQVSLIGMFTIGIPGFLLALEPNKNRIEGNFMKNVLVKALPAGITDVVAVGSLVVCGEALSLPKTDVATASTLLLAVVGFMILGKISHPFNKMKYAILAVNIAGLLFCGIFLGELFAMSEMSEICILLMIIFAFGAESFFRNLTLAADKLKVVYANRKLWRDWVIFKIWNV